MLFYLLVHYQVVVNRTSGLDVCMLDYTARDAAVVGMTVNFKWRYIGP